MKHPEVENIRAAYEVADENGKKMLCALSPELSTNVEADNRPVTVRIKTFEDACSALGAGHPFVKSLNGYVNHIHEEEMNDNDIVAYLKLRIVVAALNEGWTPDWSNKSEKKWYPWFYILTQEEYDKLDDKEKCRVVRRAHYYANAHGGLVYSYESYASSSSNAYFGARLAFKSKELAVYGGQQFGELWAEFFIG